MRGRASPHRAKMRALHYMPLLQVMERAPPPLHWSTPFLLAYHPHDLLVATVMSMAATMLCRVERACSYALHSLHLFMDAQAEDGR